MVASAAVAAPVPSLRGAAAAVANSSLADGASCCGELQEYMSRALTKLKAGPVALAIGDGRGTCCLIEAGVERDKRIRIMSASKMLTGYVFLRLAHEGRLSLQTRAAEVLSWWGAEGGGCHNVTVRHLLSQTGSLDFYPAGMGRCSARDTVGCAQEAHRAACADRPLESKFVYAETNFHVLGAIALAVTGLPTFNDVFRRYLADPLRMSPDCTFDRPNTAKADPGGGCRCTLADYALFLRAALADELVPVALRRQAEQPQTKRLGIDTGGLWRPWHYGLGQWRECASPTGLERIFDKGGYRCTDADVMGVKVSSMGVRGYYPWIFRRGRQSHWGVIARRGDIFSAMQVSSSMGQDVLPMAAAAVERLAPPSPGSEAELPPLARDRRILALSLSILMALCLTAAVLAGLRRLCARCRKQSAAQ